MQSTSLVQGQYCCISGSQITVCADNYLSERNITQLGLGHLMLLHVIRLISPETECWTGEYCSACNFFLRENEAEAAGRATARKRAREDTLTSGEYSGESKTMDERMVTAFETSVGLLARSEEKKEQIVEREMIKAMLNECGECMTPEEKKHWSRKLMTMYVKDIQRNGASQGEGGGGL
jgi:hypothetical protein